MDARIADLVHEFRRYKQLSDQAMAGLDDAAFFHRAAPAVNPIALIVKHMAGNLASRWSDFLTTDGEKPTRNRDGEFLVGDGDSREALMAAWERGWSILFATLESLRPGDLDATVTIRGEAHTAHQAIVRGLAHASYHAGQIAYLARWLAPERPWLTIAPGGSRQHEASYRAPLGPG